MMFSHGSDGIAQDGIFARRDFRADAARRCEVADLVVVDDQNRRNQIDVAFLEERQVEVENRRAGRDVLARMMERRDALAVEDDGVEADMHEHLHAARRRDGECMLRLEEERDLAVNRREGVRTFEQDGTAVPRELFGEDGVGDARKLDDFAGNGSENLIRHEKHLLGSVFYYILNSLLLFYSISRIVARCNDEFFVTFCGASGRIRDVLADGRMMDDVVDAQIDGELLLHERLGRVELARLVFAQSPDVVLPGADRDFR